MTIEQIKSAENAEPIRLNDQYLIIPGTAMSLQRNALRIEFIPPMSRCALRPKDDAAVMRRSAWNWRTDQLSRVWTDFDYCVQDGNGKKVDCDTCPFFKKHNTRVEPLSAKHGCLRHDNRGDWHFMNHREKGWSSFSYWYPTLVELVSRWAIDIGEKKTDAHGVYWTYAIDANNEDALTRGAIKQRIDREEYLSAMNDIEAQIEHRDQPEQPYEDEY